METEQSLTHSKNHTGVSDYFHDRDLPDPFQENAQLG